MIALSRFVLAAALGLATGAQAQTPAITPTPTPAPMPTLAPAEGSSPAVEAAPAATWLDPLAQRYRLGEGYRLGDTGFTLGGYGVAALSETDTPANWAASLDALSAFLWWDGGGRWQFFSELELSDAVVLSPGDSTTDEARVALERFYVDYVPGDLFKFRIGKFLTPVGHWNLSHAEPLVWTTSRPLITESTFPTNATGAMVYGVLPLGGDGLEYSVWGSPGEELFPEPRKDRFREAFGGHLRFSPLPHLRIGLSYVDFELDRSASERRNLYGFDFHFARHRWELSGEWARRVTNLEDGRRDEEGGYVQLVAPLAQKLSAVGRYEHFQESGAQRDLKLYLGGLNYRPQPALVLKAEYGRAAHNDSGVIDGFKASVAVLF